MIPSRTVLETRPPVVFTSQLALKEGNSKKPIYQIHKWWARRLGSVFRTILLSATRSPATGGDSSDLFYEKHALDGLVVLDPFVGGGTSLVEAAKCGANVIGVDIDPVACFITAKELAPCDEDALRKAFARVAASVKEQVLSWYRTKLPDGRSGTIMYAFWVDEIRCPGCKKRFQGHPHYQLFRSQTNRKQTVVCSHCGTIDTIPLYRVNHNCKHCDDSTVIRGGPIGNGRFHCPDCGTKTVLRDITGKNKRIPQRLFAVEVLVDGTKERVFKPIDDNDIALFQAARAAWYRRAKKNGFVPTETIPVRDREDPRPLSYGYRRYRDLFNARQLLCLSAIAEAISREERADLREYLAVAFSDCLAANNMFCFYAFDYRKLTPLFGLHAYTKVSRPVENNVWGTEFGRGSFEKCFYKVLRAKQYGQKPFEYRYGASAQPERVTTGERISVNVLKQLPEEALFKQPFALLLNRSSEDLSPIPAGTADLILSDPPYYNNLAYSELSDFYHVWLKRLRLPTYPGNGRRRTPLAESLYVRNAKQNLGEHDRFTQGLTRAFTECCRVLKKTGMMVFTFHHNDPKAWAALTSAMGRAGFEISHVFPVRSEGQSQFHSYEGSLKWDVVFCCRKQRTTSHRASRVNANLLVSVTEKRLRQWIKVLRDGELTLSKADERSLRSGILAMSLSQVRAGADEVSHVFSAAAPRKPVVLQP